MSIKSYVNVLLLLLVLTAITLMQPSLIPLGSGSQLSVQMIIALFKALLIVGYYMHLKDAPKLFKNIVVFAIFCLLVVVLLFAFDTYFRFFEADIFN